MNLSEHLLYRDIQELNKIARFYECECNHNSKLELVQSIHYEILNESRFQLVTEGIDEVVLRFYTYLLFQPTPSFHIDDALAKGAYIATLFSQEESPRKWVTKLLMRGMLFPVTTQRQTLLEIPEDLQRYMRKRMIEYWATQAHTTNQTPLLLDAPVHDWHIIDEGDAMIHDVQIFLDYIQKQRTVVTTVEGVMYQREQQQLFKTLHVQEAVLKDRKWRFGYGRRFPAYPARFALIYDYCFAKGWIAEWDTGIGLTPKGEEVLSNDAWSTTTQADIIKSWLKLYKRPLPSIPFLLTLSREMSKHQWVHTHALFKVVEAWLTPFYFDDIHTLFEQRFLGMAVYLGLFQQAKSGTGETYIRLSDRVKRLNL
ncbi:hypothetical protein [Caldalkalibacillus salinus]|uniref:hypothetical protein n=1 Tax=Caldalkalibacillus salinus TaxID=2803787 RepID=UPI00192336E6|nr:hypothetical protein [Caldalkalibacillus salinus]